MATIKQQQKRLREIFDRQDRADGYHSMVKQHERVLMHGVVDLMVSLSDELDHQRKRIEALEEAKHGG
ncbi:hypothetical protein [Dolosigranulum pigrum]|uniref:hypothetical protein n=1 Tax=Dolosigranulum pigrum TaxID=29394 RepID=UPI000DC57BCD|nr:hypothetical protein [Dolosigranulum pigrum]RAN53533.1 hypothetical protein B8A31_02825 [Dolosigranulum pigrum]